MQGYELTFLTYSATYLFVDIILDWIAAMQCYLAIFNSR